KIVYRLDPTEQAVLVRSYGSQRHLPGREKMQHVLLIEHVGDEPQRRRLVRILHSVYVLAALGQPPAYEGSDEEAESGLHLSAPEPLVDPGNRGPRSVSQLQNRALGVFGPHGARVAPTVAHLPFEDGLQVEPLPLAFLVVGRDAERRVGVDVLDTIQILDDLRFAERRAAGMTSVHLVVEVSRAALDTDAGSGRCQPRAGARLGHGTDGKTRRDNAERTPLVVDEAVRTEFRDPQETRALDEPGSSAPVGRSRYVRHQREPREVVSR